MIANSPRVIPKLGMKTSPTAGAANLSSRIIAYTNRFCESEKFWTVLMTTSRSLCRA